MKAWKHRALPLRHRLLWISFFRYSRIKITIQQDSTQGKTLKRRGNTPYKSSLKDMIYLSETADMRSLLSGQEAS